MNVSILLQTAYENLSDWTLGQNKPNSNPNKPNLRKAQMNVNLTLTKDYRKKDDFAVRKNKPNSNPISVKPKMSANIFITKDYENETAFRLQKNKPKQSQFLCPQRGKTEVRCRFSEVRYLSSAFCFCRKASCGLSSVHGHQPPPASYLPPQFSLKFALKNAPALLRNRCVAQEIFEKLLICTCFYSIIVLFYTLYTERHIYRSNMEKVLNAN